MGFGKMAGGGGATQGKVGFNKPQVTGGATQGTGSISGLGGKTGGVSAGKGTYSAPPAMTTKAKPVSGGAVKGVGTFRKV